MGGRRQERRSEREGKSRMKKWEGAEEEWRNGRFEG